MIIPTLNISKPTSLGRKTFNVDRMERRYNFQELLVSNVARLEERNSLKGLTYKYPRLYEKNLRVN